MNSADLSQIKTAIENSLMQAVANGATIEQAFAAHTAEIFTKYPGIAAALTQEAGA